MPEFFRKLFDTADFPARWGCGRWSAELGWLHILSDIAVFGAYMAIPVLLIWVQRRRDIVYPKIFWLFGAFIACCGTVHLIEAGIFWWPVYRLSGLVKLATAVVSWATVIALIRVVPQVLRFPGLAEMNAKLESEIEERVKIEERLRVVFEAAPNGMIVIGPDGRIRMVNSQVESLFGYERSELLGMPIETLVPERLRKTHESTRNQFFENPDTRQMGEGRELFGLNKAGEEIPIEIGLNPVETEEGSLVLAAVVNISERKRAADQLAAYSAELERSNDELDRFAYVASHDLKAPLRGIDSLAQWIDGDNEDLPDESRRHLELMRKRIGRMEQLLDDLLLYSRAGRADAQISETDCDLLVRDIVEMLHAPAQFRFRILNPLPTFETARVPLEQCLRNMIGNAIKHHHRADGTVEIDWQDRGHQFEFSVRDDGPGIEPEFHERIFAMFQTLRSRDEIEGSGMGLAVIRKTVSSFGGRIWLESALGQGTIFRMTWPKILTPQALEEGSRIVQANRPPGYEAAPG